MLEYEDIAGNDISFELRGKIVSVVLNRPDALNALSHEMAKALEKRLLAYEKDSNVSAIIIEGSGERAFCAGGDVRRLYDDGLNGGSYPYEFYPDEYRLNAYIFNYPKPYIALIDGIDMGGGVGVSVHGSHRIVTERINFAMPETGIGLFPDVGGSFFLSRLPGEIGLYMAMTGARLNAADAVYVGVGDAYVPSANLTNMKTEIEKSTFREDAHAIATGIIMDHAEDPGESQLKVLRRQIDTIFSADTVEEMLAQLDKDRTEWAKKTAASMRLKSPTSMKIALRQIRCGARLNFHECMRMEYRIAYGCIHGHDFYEGVRAAIIDKDHNPKWDPNSLEKVKKGAIDVYFERTPPGGDLKFDPPVFE